MSQSKNRFSCPACSRTFPWKPESAGRQAKCKCGHILTVPAEAPEIEQDVIALEEAVVSVAADQPPCPSCGQPMTPGAVLCLICGYNLQTGGHVTTRVGADEEAAPAPTAAPASTPYPGARRRGPSAEEESAGSTKLYLMFGAALLVAAMAVGGWIVFKGTGGASANIPKLGDDARVESMIKEQTATDLKDWINAHPSRMLSGRNRGQALAMADRLLGMGATKVMAFGAGVMCMSIAIELPKDPAQRAELFKWYDRNLDPNMPRTKDLGQRYLLYFTGL